MQNYSLIFRSLPLFFLTVCFCFVLGCGSGDPTKQRYLVKGAVTLDGKPLNKGRIIFESAAQGSFDSADINNGSYELKTTAGKKTVRIRRPIVRVEKLSTGEMDKVEHETLPARYNTASTITKEVSEDESKNKFDFKVTSK